MLSYKGQAYYAPVRITFVSCLTPDSGKKKVFAHILAGEAHDLMSF